MEVLEIKLRKKQYLAEVSEANLNRNNSFL